MGQRAIEGKGGAVEKTEDSKEDRGLKRRQRTVNGSMDRRGDRGP
jgi:hypothetical protein